MVAQRIAVIGSGIAGLSAAWLLSRAHDVTLFEQDGRTGGHSNTVDVASLGASHPVDTGFIVYNPPSYPNLTAMFVYLGVPTSPSSMSFSVSLDNAGTEYSGSGLAGIFAQPLNVLRPAHWKMISEILRFFKASTHLAEIGRSTSVSLGEWLTSNRFDPVFVRRHILPMGAAIWSSSPDEILEFPALSFARFFENHGLLRVRGRPKWRTVAGGSRNYVRRLLQDFSGTVALNRQVVRLEREGSGVTVTTVGGQSQSFDGVILACHADQALAMMGDADPLEKRVLAAFRYARNEAVLHRDVKLMPKRRRVWSSWNFIGDSVDSGRPACVTYWMNSLQPLTTRENIFVSLNPRVEPARDSVISRFTYDHPLFDRNAMTAQELLPQIQGRRNTWFAGSYCGFGFHEDALQSGLWAAEQIGGVLRPWRVANPSARIFGGLFDEARLPASLSPVVA